MDLSQLELDTTLKQLEFLRTDLEYKKLKIENEDSNFGRMVKEVLKENPKLEELYNKKEEEFLDSIINNNNNNNNNITDIVLSNNYNDNNSDNNNNIDNDDHEHNNLNNNEETADNVIENIERDEKSKEIKKLYRNIVKETHPDIIDNKFKNDLYMIATDYYNENDIYGIWDVCNKLDIQFEIEYQHIVEIKNKVIELKNKIDFLEKTFTWQWSKAKNELQKKKIIIQFINLKLNK